MALSIAQIKSASPGGVLRDASVPGLQLRCFPKRRSFYLYFRTRTGIQRKPKIGDWPTITLEQARAIARNWLAEVRMGGDPSKARKDALQSPTMADLAARYHRKHGRKKKSGDNDERLWRLHILPRMRSLRVSDVTTDDVENFMEAMEESPIQANRCCALLSKAFNLAVKWRWRTDNPAKGADRYPENKRKRYLTREEYQRLAAALAKLEQESPGGVAAIRLLMLTGARLGEIVQARREWLRNGILYLPDSKTGEKEIHLPTVALDVLRRVEPLDGWLVGISSRPSKAWAKALRMAEITNLTIHDLRHSFASEALADGLTLDQIGELLGHKSTQTTKRYAHLIDEMRAKASAQVAERVAGRMRLDGG